MTGEPFGQSWGIDTGFRVGENEVRLFSLPGQPFEIYVTAPGGYEGIRKIVRCGEAVTFERRENALLGAKLVASAGGVWLDPCHHCGIRDRARLVDGEDGMTFVRCEGSDVAPCGATGPRVPLGTRSRSLVAADRWNTRVSTSPIE